MMPMTVFAQSFEADRLGSISVTLKGQDGSTPITNAELSLYYVANVELNDNNNLSYTFTDTFKDCGVALDDPALSTKLDIFVEEHTVSSTTQVTDFRGQADFVNLPLGLYFVKQTSDVLGYAPCTSFLVTVPNENVEGYVFDVNASPKTEAAKLTSITVKKVWNTEDSTPSTDSVTVQLLRDGAVVETATLNSNNNWQVTYVDMPQSDVYSILETNVPKGFTATYSQNGYVFTVTNSASLIQTGQLVWPIPVLGIAGIILIATGVVLLKKTRDKNA